MGNRQISIHTQDILKSTMAYVHVCMCVLVCMCVCLYPGQLCLAGWVNRSIAMVKCLCSATLLNETLIERLNPGV